MKKYFLMIAFAAIAITGKAPDKPSSGDLYEGMTRKITYDRMIPPYGLEVTFDKTTHVIFPANVRYVDLGSPNIIA